MKYPNKRVMFFALQIPELSATFIYNEILRFEKEISPVDVVSMYHPSSEVSQAVQSQFSGRVHYLYGRSRWARWSSVCRVFIRSPINATRAFLAFLNDLLSKDKQSGLGFRFCYAAILSEQIKAKGVTHIHAHFAHVPGDIAMYASMMTSVPFSLTGHANDIYNGWLLPEKAERSLFFSTISEFNRKLLIAKGCNSKKLTVIRTGIDSATFQYRPPASIANREIRIGSLGRLVPKKGFHLLLRACTILKAESIPFRLELAGSGALLGSLKDDINELGLSDCVELIGVVQHEDVPAWLDSLDLFALACCEEENGDKDGVPVTLMEAMAIGVPVVTTNIAGLPELVEHNVTGLVCDQTDVEGIGAALIQLATDAELRKKISGNALRHIENTYLMHENVSQLGELIFPSNE